MLFTVRIGIVSSLCETSKDILTVRRGSTHCGKCTQNLFVLTPVKCIKPLGIQGLFGLNKCGYVSCSIGSLINSLAGGVEGKLNTLLLIVLKHILHLFKTL